VYRPALLKPMPPLPAQLQEHCRFQMLDINRAEPEAFVVRPLPEPRRALRARKKKAMEQDEFDPEWLDLVVPARSNSNLLDQMAAASSIVVDRPLENESENESEDDDADYTIRRTSRNQESPSQQNQGRRTETSRSAEHSARLRVVSQPCVSRGTAWVRVECCVE